MISKKKIHIFILAITGLLILCSCLFEAKTESNTKSVTLPVDPVMVDVRGLSYGEILQAAFNSENGVSAATVLAKTAAPLLFDKVYALSYYDITWSHDEVPDTAHINRFLFYNPRPANTEDWDTQLDWYERHPGYVILTNTELKRSGSHVVGNVEVKKGMSTQLLVLFVYQNQPVWEFINYYYWDDSYYPGYDGEDGHFSSSDRWSNPMDSISGYRLPAAQPDTGRETSTNEPPVDACTDFECDSLTLEEILYVTGNTDTSATRDQMFRVANGRISELDLSYLSISSLPSSIAKISELTYINLIETGMYELPSTLSQLSKLESLDIGYNRFESFPSELLALTQLTGLFMPYNGLTAVPSGISSMAGLLYLDLSNNNLTELPSTIVNLNLPPTDMGGDFKITNNQICTVTQVISDWVAARSTEGTTWQSRQLCTVAKK
ncbi:MAG: leucine-rich repeat domain-containing protein [Fibrobacteria bacterium]|nr:leucine-rich repeat domain-containing protein [Fibrobacteria bacterium]